MGVCHKSVPRTEHIPRLERAQGRRRSKVTVFPSLCAVVLRAHTRRHHADIGVAKTVVKCVMSVSNIKWPLAATQACHLCPDARHEILLRKSRTKFKQRKINRHAQSFPRANEFPTTLVMFVQALDQRGGKPMEIVLQKRLKRTVCTGWFTRKQQCFLSRTQ